MTEELTPLQKAHAARAARIAAGETAVVESNPIRKFRAKPTRSSAIKAMCAHCMGCTDDSIEPGFRGLVRDCASTACPLWQFRPYRGKDDPEDAETEVETPPAPVDAMALFA